VIRLEDYPIFNSDINTKNTNLSAICVIGWNKSDNTRTEIGTPADDAIYISQKKEVLDNIYYADVDLNVPSMSESIDFIDNKYKINNIGITVSNFLANGERFSDKFENKSIINKEIAIFWKSQNCKSITDCYPLYVGICRKINHTKDNVRISVEDFSDIYLEKEVPINTMESNVFTDNKNSTKSIPMTYGDIDAVPVPFSTGETTGTIKSKLTLHVDSHPLYHNAFDISSINVGGTPIYNASVMVMDNGTYFPVSKFSRDGVLHSNFKDYADEALIKFEVDYSDIISELNVNVDSIYNESGDFEFPTEGSVEYNMIDELITSSLPYISDTYNDVIRIEFLQSPSKVDMNYQWNTNANHPPPQPTLRSYASEEDWSNGIYGEGINFDETKGYNVNSQGGLGQHSFIEASGLYAANPRGANNVGSMFQLIADFESTGIPFSSSLYTAEDGNTFSVTGMHQTIIRIKAKSLVTQHIKQTIRHYDGHVTTFPENDGLHINDYASDADSLVSYDIANNSVGSGICPHYYSNEHIGALWVQTGFYGTYWDRTSPAREAGKVWSEQKGYGSCKQPTLQYKNLNGETVTERSWISDLNTISGGSQWNNTYLLNIQNIDYVDKLHIGFGHFPKSNDLYYRSFIYNQQFLYYHHVAIRLYNLRLQRTIDVKGLKDKEYFCRIDKGRVGGVYGNNDFERGYAWAIRHITTNELGIPKENIDDEAYNNVFTLESNLSNQDLAFSQFEPITAKKLFQKMCQSTQFTTKCKYNGKFSYEYLKSQYNETDITDFIDTKDVISYSYSQTPTKKIFSKVKMQYHKDYGRDKYSAYLETSVDDYILNNGLNEYNLDYYRLADYDNATSQSRHTSTTMNFKSDFIRSNFINQHRISGASLDRTGIDDGYATEFSKFLLLNNCQQKLIIDLEVPLSYLWIETGDIVSFKDLIGDLKAFGNDYTKLQQINGMWCYPAFIVTKVNKTTKSIRISIMQLWYLNDDNAHNWFAIPEDVIIYGCTNALALNYNPNATAGDPNEFCYFYGDPNQDGLINVIDIIAIINAIIDENIDNYVNEVSQPYYRSMDINSDGIINVLDIIEIINLIVQNDGTYYGCTNPDAINYEPDAIQNDGSCILPNNVCSDPHALNYDATGGVSNQLYLDDDSIAYVEDVVNNDVCQFLTDDIAQNYLIDNDELTVLPQASDLDSITYEQYLDNQQAYVINPYLIGLNFVNDYSSGLVEFDFYDFDSAATFYNNGTYIPALSDVENYYLFFAYIMNNQEFYVVLNSALFFNVTTLTEDILLVNNLGSTYLSTFNFPNWLATTSLTEIKGLAYYTACNIFNYPLGVNGEYIADSGLLTYDTSNFEWTNILHDSSGNPIEFDYVNSNLIGTTEIDFNYSFRNDANGFQSTDYPYVKPLNCFATISNSSSNVNTKTITLQEGQDIIEQAISYNELVDTEFYDIDNLLRSEYYEQYIPSYFSFNIPMKNTRPINIMENDNIGFYSLRFENISTIDPNDKIKIFVINNGKINNDIKHIPWVIYKDSENTAVCETNLHLNSPTNNETRASVIYEQEYLANEIYDDWGNSIMTTGKFPLIRIKVNETDNAPHQYINLVSIVVVYLPSSEFIGQSMQFDSPIINDITEQEYNDAIQ